MKLDNQISLLAYVFLRQNCKTDRLVQNVKIFDKDFLKYEKLLHKNYCRNHL